MTPFLVVINYFEDILINDQLYGIKMVEESGYNLRGDAFIEFDDVESNYNESEHENEFLDDKNITVDEFVQKLQEECVKNG